MLSEDFSASSGVAGSDARNYVFKQDVEVAFEGETTLDNGLRVGATVELEGQTTADDQIDSVYAFFSGGFGEIRFGDTEEAYAQFCYLVPSASELFGADSPDINFSNAGVAGYAPPTAPAPGSTTTRPSSSISSPTFGGFSSPPPSRRTTPRTPGTSWTGPARGCGNDDGQNSENLSLAAQFAHDFNGVTLTLGGGGTFSFNKEANPNNTGPARGYNAYAQIEFSDITIRRRHRAAREPRRRRRRPMGLRRRRYLRPGRLDVRTRLDPRRLRERPPARTASAPSTPTTTSTRPRPPMSWRTASRSTAWSNIPTTAATTTPAPTIKASPSAWAR